MEGFGPFRGRGGEEGGPQRCRAGERAVDVVGASTREDEFPVDEGTPGRRNDTRAGRGDAGSGVGGPMHSACAREEPVSEVFEEGERLGVRRATGQPCLLKKRAAILTLDICREAAGDEMAHPKGWFLDSAQVDIGVSWNEWRRGAARDGEIGV